MEGPLEIKDSHVPVEELIKSETVVQSPNSSGCSDGASSPPPNCSICLGKLINTSFTDSCLHQFCFTCLLQWSKIKTECPLCKQTFKSIIHNVRSEEDYDQYHVPRELAPAVQSHVSTTLDVNIDVEIARDSEIRRFIHRQSINFHDRASLMRRDRYRMLLNAEQAVRREQIPSIPPQVSRDERRRRRANPLEYRRTVYRLGMWASPLTNAAGRFRECSANYYRLHPAELDRLVPWLSRELIVLLNNAPHVAYVMRIIMDALTQYDIRSTQFRDIVRPYFGMHTDHFVYELLNFARAQFDLVGYDQSVVYLPHGLSNEVVPQIISPTSSSSSTTSDDSDVRVVDEAIDLRVNTQFPPVGPHAINMPGPSTVRQTFQLDRPHSVLPDVLTILSSSSDDECEVIGFVKSRHERTPEIIELCSSDSEGIIQTAPNIPTNDKIVEECPPSTCNSNLPSTSTSSNTTRRRAASKVQSEAPKIKLSTSSSTSTDTDSDSDYNVSYRRPKRHRSHSKKSIKRTTRRRKGSSKTSRNQSSSGESEEKKRASRKTRRSSQLNTAKKRHSSSSDSSYKDNEKKFDGERTRKMKSTKGAVRVRKDLSKYDNTHSVRSSSTESSSNSSSTSSSSSNSSSDTDDNAKNHKSSKKRFPVSSSDDENHEKSSRNGRNKDDPCSSQSNTGGGLVKNHESYRYDEARARSKSRSSSESSYPWSKTEKSNPRRKETRKDDQETTNENPTTSKQSVKNSWQKPRSPSISGERGEEEEEEEKSSKLSNSACSDHSNKSRRHKLKYKDRRKDRKRCNSDNYSPSGSLHSKASTTSKSSESKNTSSGHKEKYRSRKSSRESKYKKSSSRSQSKSKSKRRKRRTRTSSSSNSA